MELKEYYLKSGAERKKIIDVLNKDHFSQRDGVRLGDGGEERSGTGLEACSLLGRPPAQPEKLRRAGMGNGPVG